MLSLDLVQSCPASLATPGARWNEDLDATVRNADVIVTDGPGEHGVLLAPYRITAARLDAAPAGARFIPCPPFMRGREVSVDALEHPAFVGHDLKSVLLPIHQAVMAFCLDLAT